MAGQLAVAVAQPVVLSAIGKVAGEYLPAGRRPTGIAIASAGSFAGILFALILGPTVGAHGHIERLLVLEAAFGVLAGLALALALRRPGQASDENAAIEGGAARAPWALPAMRTMCGLAFVGFGVFVALATWLQTLLEPSGVSEQSAGALLVGMVVAGLIGCAVLPPFLARRGVERAFMRAAVLTSPRLRRPRGNLDARPPRGGDRADGLRPGPAGSWLFFPRPRRSSAPGPFRFPLSLR